MDEIVALFKKEQPSFDGRLLALDDVEFLNTSLPYNPIGNEKILFHGTEIKNIPNIVKNGFDNTWEKTMSGHIGKGIYFSDLMSQSIYYQLKFKYDDETLFTLIGAKVSLGKCVKLERTLLTIDIDKLPGYDSHTTPYQQDCHYGNEYCVFDANQMIPYCLIYLSVRDYK